MSFCAARVAPEKAVFRPALPMHSLPGITEMQMEKKTYLEQLKQLEALDREALEQLKRDENFLSEAILSFPPQTFSVLAALLMGYGSHDGYIDTNLLLEAHNPSIQAGRLAWYMTNYRGDECLEIVKGFKQLGPDKFIQAIREAVRKDNGVR